MLQCSRSELLFSYMQMTGFLTYIFTLGCHDRERYHKNSIKRPGVYYKQCIFSIEGDGRLLEATLFGNVLTIINRI